MSAAFTLTPPSSFSLRASARFGRAFAPCPTAGNETELFLAFPVEQADWRTVGVRVSQRGGHVDGRVTRPGGRRVSDTLLRATRDQVRRILSLDLDGRGFTDLTARDPVIAALQARYPGLRPVLFDSPYQAAAWTIIGQRIRITQAARITATIAETAGETVELAETKRHAFPAPAALLKLDAVVALSERKHHQLHCLAHAALDGALDADRLRTLPPQEALTELQRLPGIGPFASELILIRGAGDPDHFPHNERRLHTAVRAAYGLAQDTPADALRELADGWRPYRSWISVLLRTWLEDNTGEISRGRRAAQLPPPLTYPQRSRQPG